MPSLLRPLLSTLFLPLSTAFALFFVLYVYRAYDIQTGLSTTGHSLLFRAICFGLLSGISFALSAYLRRKYGKQKSWRVQMLWRGGELWMGANLTFLLFNYFWLWQEWSWPAYFLLLAEYTAVMIFPISLDWIIQLYVASSKLSRAKLVFHSSNTKQGLSLSPQNLLYIESADNYVEVHYLSGGQAKRSLIRKTLKGIEQEYRSSPFVCRCHRRYLVNPSQIQNITYENRIVTLDLGYGLLIPVSHSYQAQFIPGKTDVFSPLRKKFRPI